MKDEVPGRPGPGPLASAPLIGVGKVRRQAQRNHVEKLLSDHIVRANPSAHADSADSGAPCIRRSQSSAPCRGVLDVLARVRHVDHDHLRCKQRVLQEAEACVPNPHVSRHLSPLTLI